MRIPGRRAARTLRRWGRSRFGARAAVLGYHRVGDPGWDPLDLGLPAERLAAHLEAVRARARPVPLAAIARGLAEGRIPERAVAVTFDDGYRDNLEVAKPILERYEIPATVFVVAGARGGETWWDELARLLRPGRDLPPALRVALHGGDAVVPVSGEAARREAAVRLSRALMGFPAAAIRERLDALWAQAGGDPGEPAVHRTMTDDEIRDLARGGLIEIGSHSATHPVLAGLDRGEQRVEIAGSRAALERSLGVPVTAFSYPNGSRDANSIAEVRAAGYACACGSDPDVVRTATGRWDLPRFWLPPASGTVASAWLARWVV